MACQTINAAAIHRWVEEGGEWGPSCPARSLRAGAGRGQGDRDMLPTPQGRRRTHGSAN